MQLRYVKIIAEKYDIDLQDIHVKIERDESLLGIMYTGVANRNYKGKGRIHLLPNAFVSEEELARTIYHEKIHLEQFTMYGYENVINDRDRYEDMVDELESRFWKERKNNEMD